MKYLSFDIGTTNCKCQLFSDRGEILEYVSHEYGFLYCDGEQYVFTERILETVFSMVKEIAARHEISSICFSTFGEAFVLTGESDSVIFPPMLYTDKRGERQAEQLSELFGNEKIYRITGTLPHCMYSVSKLLYIKQTYPDLYARADKMMLMCDWLGYVFTGERVIDYSLAARTGIFDIEKLRFSDELCDGLGIDTKLFSTPKRAGTVVGRIKKELRAKLGLPEDCVLVLGSHDQICTALGAGVLSAGQAVDGMGTVECITAVFGQKCSDAAAGEKGFPIVPYAIEGLYCTYICNYASGSIVGWFKDKILHGYKGEYDSVYEYLEKGMPDGVSGLYMLPYFAGSAIPYQDVNAKGAIIGLTPSATDSRIYLALMESTAMEMRLETQVARQYGIEISTAVATGGGANSLKWLQLKADIQGIPYKTLRSSEGGLCGCAVLQATALEGISPKEAVKKVVRYDKAFEPDKKRGEIYLPYYEKYIKLYQSLKEYF